MSESTFANEYQKLPLSDDEQRIVTVAAEGLSPTDGASAAQALEKIASDDQIDPLNTFKIETEYIAEAEVSELQKTADNLRALQKLVEQGGEDAANALTVIAEILEAREELYYQAAKIINPDLTKVEGGNHLYRIGNNEIYGSIVAAVDATANVARHSELMNKLKLTDIEEVVVGETLQPRKQLEASAVFSGSSAQERIQKFGADLDGAEHVLITAENSEEAGKILALSLSRSVEQVIDIPNAQGENTRLHFLGMKVGGSCPENAAYDKDGQPLKDRTMRWSVDEIKEGEKFYLDSTGQTLRVSLADACANPSMLKIDYIGVTSNQVMEVTKVTTVTSRDADNNIVMTNSIGKAVAFQEIYFNDPSNFRLTEQTKNPESYINYQQAMAEGVRSYSDPSHLNQLKVLKRLYNLTKTEGSFDLSQEIVDVFSGDSAMLYMLVDRIGMASVANQEGIDVSQQTHLMIQQALEIANKNQFSLAGVSVDTNGRNVVTDQNALRVSSSGYINESVSQYILEHPNISKRIKDILEK